MKKTIAVLPLLLGAATATAGDTAFLNVNVLPMTSETVLREQTVIVSDGTIACIGAVGETPVPQGAEVIDGTDRYLMPGLAEMHAHVPSAPSVELDRALALYLAKGITTIRGMLGRPWHLELREALSSGEIPGPRLVTSGPSFNGNSVDSPSEAVRMVREQQAAGYDFLKIHPGLTRGEFEAMASVANEIGIPFAGHVPSAVGVPAALNAGMATIDHLDGYMEALVPRNEDPSGGVGGFFGLLLAGSAEKSRIGELARATAEAEVWNVPTQALFEHVTNATDPEVMAEWPEMRYMPAETVDEWVERKSEIIGDPAFDPALAARAIELRRALILALHEAGAGLLLGSDSPQIFNVPGFSLHRELALLVEAGLTPYEALLSGTVNPAAYFGAAGTFGTIEPGLAADLVLLDDNPFTDITNTQRIHGVMRQGRWLSREAIDGMLERFRRDSGP
jgi:imidazolonepropionase-like amidohydrolase